MITAKSSMSQIRFSTFFTRHDYTFRLSRSELSNFQHSKRLSNCPAPVEGVAAVRHQPAPNPAGHLVGTP
jgi:hypothetical protein